MKYISKILKTGLFWVNFLIALIGISISLILFELYGFYPLLIFLIVLSLFNTIIGATNSPNNITSKFRKWLFSEKEETNKVAEIDIFKVAKKLSDLQKRRLKRRCEK